MTCAFLLQENIQELSEEKTFKPRNNDNIFHINDQIKVLRVPLGIRHCYLSMEGRRVTKKNLRLRSKGFFILTIKRIQIVRWLGLKNEENVARMDYVNVIPLPPSEGTTRS